MLIDLLSGNLEDKFGTIEAFLGPMASGKSTLAVMYITIFREFANQLNCKIDVFRPTIDSRAQMSRLGIDRSTGFIGVDPIRIETAQEILDYTAKKACFGKRRVMLFDEPEFLDSAFINVVEQLRKQGHLPILSLLDTNFRGEPFAFSDYAATTEDLLRTIPDRNKHYSRLAKCRICRQTADYSHRLINGQPAPYYDPLRVIDSDAARQESRKNYTYEPRCKEHFIVPWKEETYAIETAIKRQNGLTRSEILSIATDALHIPADVTEHTLTMFVTEKRVIEHERKFYIPPKIVTATVIPPPNT